MFDAKSISILNTINSFYSKDKNRNKYRVIITPPYTLIKVILNISEKKVSIGAQNCYQKEQFSSNTAAKAICQKRRCKIYVSRSFR